jgi:hypothetical protein
MATNGDTHALGLLVTACRCCITCLTAVAACVPPARCSDEVCAVLCDIAAAVVEGKAAKELVCMHAKRVTQHRRNNTALLCTNITARCQAEQLF